MKKNIYILLSIYHKDKVPIGAESIMIEDLAKDALSVSFVKKHLFRYKSVTLVATHLDMVPMPFLVAGVSRLMTWGKCIWCDGKKTQTITVFALVKMFFLFLKDYAQKDAVIKQVLNELVLLKQKKIKRVTKYDLLKTAYIRTDLPSGIKAGGSVGHICGVLNNIKSATLCTPVFLSTDEFSLIDEQIPFTLINGVIPYRNIKNFTTVALNFVCYDSIEKELKDKDIAVLYHRYALDSYAVVKYALMNNIPYILEYNGSELWILKNWADNASMPKLSFPDISYGIESLVLQKASLITCVSTPLKEQLLQMGIPEQRILVNPNGVDIQKYNPGINGLTIRQQYRIASTDTVIGFIGTFGTWHGVEILVKAFCELQRINKDIHLLLIGDGIKMPLVKDILTKNNIDTTKYTLTGMVPQEKGPEYLAACDILVSPTLKNPDGTPFFGSPTKLFEYMAMGKAIVASNLDQLSEILGNEKTALLCEPGNLDHLISSLQRLVNDEKLCEVLGYNAREDVCKNHTWEQHTKKIFDAFVALGE